MRRTFTLQTHGNAVSCLSPSECGDSCYCGEPMQSHPITDPPHNPTPMLCSVCRAFEEVRWEAHLASLPGGA